MRVLLACTLVWGCSFDASGSIVGSGSTGGTGGSGGMGGSGGVGGTGGAGGAGGAGGVGGTGGSGGVGGTGGTGGAPADAGGDAARDGGMDGPFNACDTAAASTRVCLGMGTSAHCDGTGGVLIDRICPVDSDCQNGYCQPPPGAAPCASFWQCTLAKICLLYVNNNMLQGYCTDPFPLSGGLYADCMNDSQCKSGICSTDSQDSSHHQCLYLCRNDGECALGACHNIGTPATIEGVSTSGQKSCYR